MRKLSKDIGVSHGHLSDMLNGKTKIKRIHALKLMDFLNVPAKTQDLYINSIKIDGAITEEYDRVVSDIVEIDFDFELIDHLIYAIFNCASFKGNLSELIDRTGFSKNEVLNSINKLEVNNILRRNEQGRLYAPYVKIMRVVKEKQLVTSCSLKCREKILNDAMEINDFSLNNPGERVNKKVYMPFRFMRIPRSKIDVMKKAMFVMMNDIADSADNLRSTDNDDEVFVMMPVLISMEANQELH